MSAPGDASALRTASRAAGERRSSIWPSIYPRVLELVLAHRTTIIFCNARRAAERLAAKLNELYDEQRDPDTAPPEIELARAHHGSLAREQRVVIEDQLKRGELRAIVATSSLELGIDMGAVDLVIQIESPGAVSRGLQRIGRAGHQVGQPSKGSIFPKHRGDLVEAAVVTRRMIDGEIEHSRYMRNPLDVLAQQIVAHVAAVGFVHRRRAGGVGAALRQLPRAVRRAARQRARPARRPLPERRVLRAAAAHRVGPRGRHHPAARRLQAARRHQRRHHPRPRPVRRVPARRHARRRARRGDGLREPPRRRVRARRLHVAHRGHLVRARHRHPGAGRAGEDAVLARRPAGPPARTGASGRCVRPRDPRPVARRRASNACSSTTRSTRGPPATSCSTSPSRPRPPARCPTIARSSSSASATRSATGGCACSARSARRCTPRGRWRSSAASSNATTSRSRRCGATTASSSACPSPPTTSTSRRSSCRPTRSKRSSCRRCRRRRCSRPASASAPAARCCCRAGGPTGARRCGSSASVRPTCSRWRRSTRRSRSCSRRRASVCRTCSTCRRCARCSASCSRAASGWCTSTPRRRARWRRACCSTGSPPTCTRATRRSPSAAPPRSRSTATCCATCSAPRSCASCSTPACSPTSNSSCNASPTAAGRGPPTSCTTCCAGSATSPRPRSTCAARPTAPALLATLVDERRAIEIGVAGEVRFAAADDAAKYRDALGCAVPVGLPVVFTDPVPRPLEVLVARYARTHGPFLVAEVARRFGAPLERIEGVIAALAADERLILGEFRPDGVHREWCDPDVLRQLRRRSLATLAPRDRTGRARRVRALPAGVARHRRRAARHRGARRRDRHAGRAHRWWRPRSSATCCPHAWPPTARRRSTSCAPAATSCGSAPGRSAPATVASGCASPTRSPCSLPDGTRPNVRRARSTRGSASCSPRGGCAVLGPAPRGRRRRHRHRAARCALGSRLGRRGDERLAGAAAGGARRRRCRGTQAQGVRRRAPAARAASPASARPPAPAGGAWSSRCCHPRPAPPRRRTRARCRCSTATAW